jgi:predicted ATPase
VRTELGNPEPRLRESSTADLEKLLSRAAARGLSPALRRSARRTNWWVVSGTYSAGKTTLLSSLSAAKGIASSSEPARVYLQARVADGASAQALWTEQTSLIGPIHKERKKLETSLDPEAEHLLDTAIPDTLAYALLYNEGIDEVVRDCGLFAYRDPILFVRPLALAPDGLRHDDANERLAVSYLRERIYELLGYRILSVPVEAPQARLTRVLHAMRPERKRRRVF